jgi:hypothetical protein
MWTRKLEVSSQTLFQCLNGASESLTIMALPKIALPHTMMNTKG